MAHSERAALVIDDDPFIADIALEFLRSLGLKTEKALDAAQGLAMAESKTPLLILSDIHLSPTETGFHLYRAFRKNPSLREIPVIFMTSLDPLSIKGLIPQDPRVRIVYKPLNLVMLEQAVTDLLGIPPKSA